MIQVLPESKMGQNSEVGLAQMHKDRNLQDGIGIQMGQVQIVKIKETAKEGSNGKSKAADEKRDIDNRLVGVFCWNNNPTANPPRTELFWRKKIPTSTRWRRSNSETTDMWLPANDN
jgi:hypothetical protein